MNKIMTFAKRFVSDESGATMAEYALVVALIALVAMAGATTLGTNLSSKFTSISTSFS